jgi:hypothetical protein
VTDTRRKARVLAATSVVIGWCAAAFSVVSGAHWPVKLINLTVFGATCAIAGVTWWGTQK